MSRTTRILLLVAVLLTLEILLFETSPPPWTGAGKVFPGLETGDIVELEISRPAHSPDEAVGVYAGPVRLRYDGTSPAWRLVKPIRFPAFHPRVMGIVYGIVDAVRVAEASPEVDGFPEGPEIRLRFRTRGGEEREMALGRDHPDEDLGLCYARVGDEVFTTRSKFKKLLTVTVTELRSRALFPVAPPDTESLTIAGDPSFAKTIARVGEPSRWRLRDPIDALADREITENLLEDLNSWTLTEFEMDDADEPAELEPFGLDEPTARVTLRHRQGTSVSLEIGKEFRDGEAGMVYVRHAGEPFVFRARSDLLDRLYEPAENYRSRFVFDLGLDEIVKLELRGPDGVFVLRSVAAAGSGSPPDPTSSTRDWEVYDPSTGRTLEGDRERILLAVVGLRELPIEKFVSSETPLAEIGLAPPRGTVQLTTEADRELELLLGDPCTDPDYRDLNVYHVARPGEPGSYLCHLPLAATMAQGPWAFRKRNLATVEPSRILELEVRDGDDKWFLGRLPGEPWGLSTRSAILPQKRLKQEVVDELVDALDPERFRVEQYLPDLEDFHAAGIELMSPLRAVILLRLEEPGFRKLVLGRPVKGSIPRQVYARVDQADVPPFTLLEDGVPRSLELLIRHLREITGR